MITRCKICEKEFYSKPNRLKQGWGKYCSRICQHKSQKTGNIYRCTTCSKQVYKTNQDQIRSMSNKYFCNRSCQTVWRNKQYIEDKHANWKGGESSYRNIMIRAKITRVCAKCGGTDTRTLAVHHKDKIRQHNTLSNLVWLCHNCHFLVHHYKDEAGTFLVPVA